ncbi:chemotaxis protein CheX [Gemmata sp. JC717]|uniref:chemotaxis protein CheX n=1 Tax=Gemmata algarum TaxID=2975278 RepID=UPI0021BA7D33|nr:chemotaxis protein CheX [Gemmata algarum]MDY3555618.1 chemotaxis protein CheX [Gemmata algarum]
MVATLPTANTFPPAVSEAVEGAAATFFSGSCGLTHVPDAQIDDAIDQAGIMSTISFVGDIQWAFALAFPEEAAVAIARTFAGFDIPFNSADMGDVIGEIVNVIAGDVVGRLAKQKIEARMSLPTTVHGSNVSMMMPTDAAATRFVFSGPAGRCWFDLVSTPKPLTPPGQEESPESATRWGGSDPPVTPPPVGTLAPVPAPAAAPAPHAAPDPSQDAWAAAMAEAERQMAEQDALDAAARAAGLPVGPAAEPVVVRGGSRMMPLVLVLACAGWGGLVSLIAAGGPHRPAPEAAAPEHAEAAAAPKAPTAEVDELIRSDQFDDALKACFKAAKKDPKPSETALTLREALCLEGQGRWGEAVGVYQRAEADPDTVTSVVALLGQARCATQDGSYVIARALTNRALLRSGAPGFRGTTVRKDIQHLQARIALQAAGAKPLPRDASARPLLSASPTNGLEWLPATPPPPPPAGDTFEVHRTLGAPKVLQVSGTLSRRPVLEVLNALAATAGWKLQVSAEVAAQLKWAVGPIEIDHLTLPEFLNVLMDGTSVTWAVDADTLRLALPARKEAAPKK